MYLIRNLRGLLFTAAVLTVVLLILTQLQHLRTMAAINLRLVTASRTGQVAVSGGMTEPLFVAAFEDWDPCSKGSPALLQDLIITHAKAGRHGDIIALYERCPAMLRPFPLVVDAVAASYLKQMKSGMDLSILREVEAIRPDDLYVNYQLWQQAVNAGNFEAAAHYRRHLEHFSSQAADPSSEVLLGYAGGVIPELLRQELWSFETTLRVVSMLVWRNPNAHAVETLLQRLSASYPEEPDWQLLLGEFYQRSRNLSLAAETYERLADSHPQLAEVKLRQAMVAQAQAQELGPASKTRFQKALAWYEEYHRSAPNALLPLQTLLEMGTVADDSTSANMRNELQSQWDGRQIAARILDAPVNSIDLGPNLVRNGEFASSIGDGIADWERGIYAGKDGASAVYEVGPDELGGDVSIMRLQALRGGALEDGTTTYAELTGAPFRADGQRYLITLEYAASGFSVGTGLLLLSDFEPSEAFVLLETGLPDTRGEWRQLAFVAEGPSRSRLVRPLLRNWGDGEIRVMSLAVRPIEMTE